MSALTSFYVHTLTVETYQGSGAYGPMFDDPVNVPGFLDTTSNLAQTAGETEETSAKSMFYADPTYAALFTVQSRVTSADLGGDGKATVVKLNALTSGPLGLPDHIEVGLR